MSSRSAINLEKRNRLIARYVSPRRSWDEAAPDRSEIDIPWTLEELAANWPAGLDMDIGPLFVEPHRFAALSLEEALEVLIAKAKRPRRTVTVGLDEFFDGNTDPSSIATNLADTPKYSGLGTIHEVLAAVRSRADVTDVRIGIHEWPNPEVPADDRMWPVAGEVYVWTTATGDEVARAVERLHLSAIREIPEAEMAAITGPEAKLGLRLFALVWD
jgi:hypothetical protein